MASKISDIRLELQAAAHDELPVFINKYACDERAGVQELVHRAEKMLAKYEDELIRIEGMKKYEKMYAQCEYICGIDEVGRGPLAGPVVACAVVLPKDCDILYLNDSKQLSEKMRNMLYEEIIEKAVGVGIGMASNERIDEINILQADYEAMREAVGRLGFTPDILLNDAVTIPGLDIRQVPIIKGDTKSISIAAASIVAKVTRDRMMVEMDSKYPGYNFAKNKGYGSREHIEAIKCMGASPIHRKTFIKSFVNQ